MYRFQVLCRFDDGIFVDTVIDLGNVSSLLHVTYT